MTFSKDILNAALELSMEFGPDFLKPIHTRLLKKYPSLTDVELDAYNRKAYQTKEYGHEIVYKLWPGITDEEAHDQSKIKFKKQMKSSYDWINDENISRLFSQSCYFASK